ncbi:MAG TPA: DUF1993 domain-containing protein [Caulobacteraceae bacterium]|jgi:hypothetical protein|nr:DUF1993 domain-containing protein [Caulobacteraceae bacterium]
MATSLYDLSVATYLQTLGGVAGVLQRGLDHFSDNGIDPNAVVEARLFDDMLPFKFQIWSVSHHSIGAIEGIKKGVFNPPGAMPALDYAGLQKVVSDAVQALGSLEWSEVNALEGKDVAFQFGEFKVPFVAETFVMSFSLPNFYFHAATTYDILRTKGVPLGKRDFMGKLRMKA